MLFEQLLAGLAPQFNVECLNLCPCPDIRDVSLLDDAEAEYDDEVVYFGYSEKLGGKLPRQYIVTAPAPAAESSCAAQIADDKLFSAFNQARRLIEASTGHGLYNELTAAADETGSVDDVLNAAALRLGNSLIFSDMEYRIISSSTAIPVIDPLWSNYIKQGYCPYEFVSGASKLEAVRNAPYTPDAMEVSCDESPYRKLSSKVMLHGTQVGFVLMIASETPVAPQHFNMLRSVSLALTYTVSNYASGLFSGIDRFQQLLYSLLIGAPAVDLAPAISSLELPESMAALCLRQKRYLGQRHMRETVIDGLCREFSGAHAVDYEDCAAAIIPLDGIELGAGDFARLDAFAAKNALRVGVSYSFNRIENFPAHYGQAVAALDISRRLGSSSSAARYEDFQIYDLLNSCGDAELGKYCHPALELLRQYDHRQSSELYNTLRAYADSGGSVKLTADALFIHRNSLMYRLDRIREITGLNINDAHTLYVLKLSFDIDRHLGMGS